jgi:hypothetical protein
MKDTEGDCGYIDPKAYPEPQRLILGEPSPRSLCLGQQLTQDPFPSPQLYESGLENESFSVTVTVTLEGWTGERRDFHDRL